MKKGHNILSVKRSIVIAATIIIAILSVCFLFYYNSKQIISSEITSLRNAADAVAYQYDSCVEKDSIYDKYCFEAQENINGYIAYCISTYGYNTHTSEDLFNELSKYVEAFYFKGSVDYENHCTNGTFYSVFSTYAKNSPELTKEEIYLLLSTGQLSKDEFSYSIYKMSDSEYIVTRCTFTDFIIRPEILSADNSMGGRSIILADGDTGIIKDSNKKEFIGTNYSELINDSELKKIQNADAYILKLSNGNKAIVCFAQSTIDNSAIYAISPIKDLIPLYIRNMCIPVLLTVSFLILIMFYMLSFMKPHNQKEKSDIEYFHFYKNIYSDSKLLSHNLGLGILSIIVVISSTSYVQTLINHSSNSLNAVDNLQTLVTNIDASEKNLSAIKADMLQTNTTVCDILADHFLKHPEEINNEDLTKICDFLPYAYSLTVIDKTGTIEAATTNRVGYTLSSDALSPENVFQDVLYGSVDSTYFTDEYYYYTLSRRQDKTGLISYTKNGYYYYEFENNCSIDSDLRSIDFQTSTKGYINKEKPDTIYWIAAKDNSNEVQQTKNIFTEEELSSKSFVTRINNIKQMVHIVETDKYYLFSATEISELNGLSNIAVNLIILFAFLIQQIIIFLTNLCKNEETPAKKISLADSSFREASMSVKSMDIDFRRLFSIILIVSVSAIILLIIIDSIFEPNSIVSYIVNSQWPKGFNLFSLTMILVSTFTTFFVSKILKTLLIFFTNNMGPRGLTIGKMLSSIISFLALIITLLLAVIYLGVNYTALLAGAGIAGVALTVCAQSSISDMLSGFLIVFENLFNIGDWITVGDFRGQVTEIGLRTTKLQISKTVKIFNNTELKNVTIMERNGQGCVVLVDIAYKEDANKVIELLRNSTERYQADIPAIKEGPYIDGIVDLSSSGVTLYIWAIAELEYIKATEREIRRVTKNIFDENKIEIPFSQITLHEADEKRYFNGITMNKDNKAVIIDPED